MTGPVRSLAGPVLVWVAGCATSEVEELPERDAGSDESGVLAQVNGAVITLSDFRRSLERAPAGLGELSPERYLQALIDEELLLQEAERRGLAEAADFQRSLQKETRRLALRELYRREGIPLAPPSDEEMRAWFESSPYRYLVRFSALMVENVELIQQILAELEQGADFEALSIKHSRDSRIVDRNADMGFHRWGTTSPAYRPVADLAFATPVGEIGGPVRAADGYFLIKVTGVKPVSFDVEREAVERLMIEERLSGPLEKYYGALRRDYGLRIDEAGLAALAAEFVDPSASSHHQGHGTHGRGKKMGGREKMTMAAADTGGGSTTVVAFRGDRLSLARCRALLRDSGREAFPTIAALRNHLAQVASREALALHEILRMKLLTMPEVENGVARARRKLLVGRMRKQLMAEAAPADENKEKLYFAIHKERYLRSGVEPGFEEVREQVRRDYLHDMREKLFQLALGGLRKRYEKGIVVHEEPLRQAAELWREQGGGS